MAEGVQDGRPHRGSGWFAMVVGVGVLLIVLGVWNAIDGLTALLADGFVVADAERVLALEVAAWGWVLLAQPVLELSECARPFPLSPHVVPRPVTTTPAAGEDMDGAAGGLSSGKGEQASAPMNIS